MQMGSRYRHCSACIVRCSVCILGLQCSGCTLVGVALFTEQCSVLGLQCAMCSGEHFGAAVSCVGFAVLGTQCSTGQCSAQGATLWDEAVRSLPCPVPNSDT